MIINKCSESNTPWYYKEKYTHHVNMINVLHQDTSDTNIHKLAISNHDKIELLFKHRISRRRHNFIISDGFRSYLYCYKLNKKNQPLLYQKMTL